jgi:hypothetical protein
MATSDFKTFLESRLLALSPGIDIDPGSPAQTEFIEPVLNRIGTDPFETDIDSFILDRFRQEFPDIYAGDPSVVRDVFIKPLILLLEPFKREIGIISKNQSVQDPTVISDEDADAIAANFFVERDGGGIANGVVRVYFSNPTNVDIQITTRFFTASGLNFFPTDPLSVSAEEMVFNRSGSLYFLDVTVKAEAEGDKYNVDKNEITGADSLFGVVKISNLRKFSKGSTKLDTQSFLAQVKESLTERSLVTRRGAKARLNSTFQGKARAIQVIGAGDPEMQRDILVAAAPGHSWLTGKVNIYGKIAYVQCKLVDGLTTDAPVAGDTLYIYLDPYSYTATWAGLAQSSRLVALKVEEVLAGPMTEASPYQVSFLVRWSGSLPLGVTLPAATVIEGGFRKKGTIRISSLADIGPTSLVVDNQAAHLFGHSDIYVRPVLQDTSKVVLDGLYDSTSFVERTSLTTTASDNKVSETTFDFSVNGVLPGDELIIETGNDAGSYIILAVTAGSPSYLYIGVTLTTSAANIRYRVQKRIRINPFEPKIPRLPFGSVLCNDLFTVIGSRTVQFTTNDIISYGAKIGDTIRILSGTSAGDYTITGFDSVLGGKGPIVDRAVTGSEANLTYQIFTPLETVEKPLVRIKELVLLDSAKQSTGVLIPPADPVAVTPTCNFTSARVRGSSSYSSGYVLPDFTGYVSGGNVGGTLTGRKYSLGIETPTGTYKGFTCVDSSTTVQEVDIRPDGSGSCSWFIAPIEVQQTSTDSFPPVAPKPGECLTIKTGPNKGSYLIKNVVSIRYPNSVNLFSTAYLIQIYGSFPTDIIRNIITFLDTASIASGNGAIAVPKITGTGTYAITYLQSTYNNFGTQLNLALTYYGATSPSAPTLQAAVDALAKVSYEWGDPARGSVRSYFTSPTLFELGTKNNTTLSKFSFKTTNGETIKYLPDPNKYLGYQLVPPRVQDGSPDPSTYYRDMTTGASINATFTDSSKTNVFLLGVQPGDYLEWHTTFAPCTTSTNFVFGLSTLAGSAQVSTPTSMGGPWVSGTHDGKLLFIEDGVDKGMYRVTKVVDSNTLVLDKALTTTTPTILAQGTVSNYGATGPGVNKVLASSGDLTTYLNKYLTIYGNTGLYSGSYQITAVSQGSVSGVLVNKTGGDFPAYGAATSTYFVITAAPVTTPVVVGTGTEFYGLKAARTYSEVAWSQPITSVVSDLSLSKVVISNTPGNSLLSFYKMPYRIIRPNIRRITPSEMQLNQDGPLFYTEIQVLSTSPNVSANISEDEYLIIDSGTYKSQGYKHVVTDTTLSYSTKEQGYVDIPTLVLPQGVADAVPNYLNLVGIPIQISYEKADLVSDFQDFVDSPEDRVTAANLLARHFLPSYVSYDATYTGGSAPSVIAKDIFSYIDSLGIENPVDVSVLEDFIAKRGGNPDTPTKVITVTHDFSRNRWAEFSENQLGGLIAKAPIDGTARVSYYVPGQDVSGQEPTPTGERIKLTRK